MKGAMYRVSMYGAFYDPILNTLLHLESNFPLNHLLLALLACSLLPLHTET